MADPIPGTETSPAAHPLGDVTLEVTICVGRARPSVQELLDLRKDAVLALDKRVEDPVDLYVGDRLVARGVLEEAEGAEPGRLAVRLTEVPSLPGTAG